MHGLFRVATLDGFRNFGVSYVKGLTMIVSLRLEVPKLAYAWLEEVGLFFWVLYCMNPYYSLYNIGSLKINCDKKLMTILHWENHKGPCY